MFGFISKKKLKNYIEKVKRGNRATISQKYEQPISEVQRIKNIYAQGYEDGTDNFYNALCSKFNIKRPFDKQRTPQKNVTAESAISALQKAAQNIENMNPDDYVGLQINPTMNETRR